MNTLERWRRYLACWGTLGIVALFAPCSLQAASAPPAAPQVDVSGLPPLGEEWAASNPYRGLEAAVEIGRSAFNQACARCHGSDANGARAPAPDVRRLGLSCRRVKSAALKQRCVEDVDHYFLRSVLEGKFKVGIEHMPPWKGILSPQVVWSIRSFVDSQSQSLGRKPVQVAQ